MKNIFIAPCFILSIFALISVDLDFACPGVRRKMTNHNLQISITHL